MTDVVIMELGQKAIWAALKVTAPILLLALLTGIIISVLQAVTQIQEMTLVFVPKILAVALAIVIFGPWMLRTLVGLAAELFGGFPNYIG